MMGFNILAALVIGILLPTLETIRRGMAHWFENFTTMFEDYVAGAALIVCGIGALRKASWAPLALVVVWSGITFMMLVSTVSQIERHFGDLPEPRSGVVLIAKLVLFLVCAVALAQSLRPYRPSLGQVV